MIETIALAVGQEQSFDLLYGEVKYTFELYYNDFHGYWIMNVKSGKTAFYMGLPMRPNLNPLSGFKHLGLGSFSLVDTDPNSSIPLSPQFDLGDRLKLIRSYDG